MPIVVKHGPNLQLLGAAGIAAGYGDFQKWQVEQQQKEAQLADQRRRTEAGIFGDRARLEAGAYENAAQRQFLAGREQFEANTARDLQAERFQQQAALAEFGMAKQQQLSNQELQHRQQFETYRAEVENRQKEWEWDALQERELKKIDQARLKVQRNPHWSEQQKAKIMRELDIAEMNVGLQKIKIPTPQEEFDQSVATWQSPTGATVGFVRDGRGGWRQMQIEDPQVKAQEAEIEQTKAALDIQKKKVDLFASARTALQQTNPETGIVTQPSDQEIEAYIAQANRLAVGMSQAVDNAAQQPAPQGWHPPMLPPGQQAPAPQPSVMQRAQQVVLTAPSGKQYSLDTIRQLANKRGVPIEQLLQQLGIEPAQVGF